MVDRTKKRLLVEGHDDLYAIAELMGHYVHWPDKKSEAPVIIEPLGGWSSLLDEDAITLRIKSRETEILGVVIDANNDFAGRWNRLRQLCGKCEPPFDGIPDQIPKEGLISTNADNKRLGIWIMPDNSNRGMIETFMQFLVPAAEQQIYTHSVAATAAAVKLGARCNPKDSDKSHIYAWLAWQDPPGQSMGTALVQKLLDARAPYAAAFVKWFRELFEL